MLCACMVVRWCVFGVVKWPDEENLKERVKVKGKELCKICSCGDRNRDREYWEGFWGKFNNFVK